MAKTWQQKYDTSKEPVVETLDKDFSDLKAGSTMLISTPAEVEAYVRSIPRGTALTMKELRAGLAKQHGAEGTCPLTTSIFLRIATEVALEQMGNGVPQGKVMPFWRAVDPKGPLAKKLSCGTALIQDFRRAEGIAA
ncbi:MAG TPA: hypothetical protein VLA04_04970 [Verrucomicrobiae bacterium]|nr:hypothetical protein [Verrucomicrobiae bacterium]